MILECNFSSNSDGLGWTQMYSDELRWTQMDSDRLRWTKINSDQLRSTQIIMMFPINSSKDMFSPEEQIWRTNYEKAIPLHFLFYIPTLMSLELFQQGVTPIRHTWNQNFKGYCTV